ncbi:MAG: hypothetical protein JJT94_02670 [Bernardetiaceae bacterium]|nr:hypothetical protein [Bernardetiaceae bacterium]
MIFFLFSLPAKSENTDYELLMHRADSLFNQELYIEAGRLYEEIYLNARMYSPKMFLHLAYIKEASTNYPQALYYLSLYYKTSPDVKVLEKIEKIAKAQKIEGYAYTDAAYFDTLLRRYHHYLWAVPFSLALIWLFVMFFKRRLSVRKVIAFTAFLLLFGFFYNWRSTPKDYIILHEAPATLMHAPSAASQVETQLHKAGHRLELLGQTDIWYKVRWQDKKLYIRKHNALALSL